MGRETAVDDGRRRGVTIDQECERLPSRKVEESRIEAFEGTVAY